MLWNEQRNQLTSLVAKLGEENADIETISTDITNLLNENPDEISSLEKTQSQLSTANTRLEEVRKTNRELLKGISTSSTKSQEDEEKEITIDDILKGEI